MSLLATVAYSDVRLLGSNVPCNSAAFRPHLHTATCVRFDNVADYWGIRHWVLKVVLARAGDKTYLLRRSVLTTPTRRLYER